METSAFNYSVTSLFLKQPTPRAGVRERTFIMIKPDGVKRGLVADIIKRFEQRGYKLVAMKMMMVCIMILFLPSLHEIPTSF